MGMYYNGYIIRSGIGQWYAVNLDFNQTIYGDGVQDLKAKIDLFKKDLQKHFK